MSLTATQSATSAAPSQTTQVWDNPEAAPSQGASDLRTDTVPVVQAQRPPADNDGVIDGSQKGTKLPGTQTPDGKAITVGQLHDDDTVSITRETTNGDAGYGQTYVSDDEVVLTTKGDANDNIQVTQRDDGTLDLNVNGQSYQVKLAQGQQFAIRTGAGDDTINVAPNVKVNFVVDGGDGNDTITTGAGNDHVDGGAGDDVINGGDGTDNLFGNTGNDRIDGGSGNNVLYGGDGDDALTAAGDAETNYFEGGEGSDTIDASRGKNIVSGGNGDDAITSGGQNVVYAGDGKDTITGATSKDKIYAQTSVDQILFANGQSDTGQVVVNVKLDPKLGLSGIKVEGSDAFKQRVLADLAMLQSSPDGQQMLKSYDDVYAQKGHTLTIREYAREANSVTYPANDDATYSDIQVTNGKAGPGVDTIIEYNPNIDLDSELGKFAGFVPSVVLYHEMSHGYNMTHGNMLSGTYTGSGPDKNQVPNSERQAVGLDTTATPYDFGDGSGPITHNPFALTENGLREEMGLPDRPSYAL